MQKDQTSDALYHPNFIFVGLFACAGISMEFFRDCDRSLGFYAGVNACLRARRSRLLEARGAARREVEGLSRATFFVFLFERTSRLRDGYGRARGGVGSVGRLFGDADRESRRGGRRARGRDLTSTDAVRARALARRTSRDMSFRPPPARRAREELARVLPRTVRCLTSDSRKKRRSLRHRIAFRVALPPPPRPTQGANARDVARTSESARKTSPLQRVRRAAIRPETPRSRPPRALSFPHPRAFFPSRVWAAR